MNRTVERDLRRHHLLPWQMDQYKIEAFAGATYGEEQFGNNISLSVIKLDANIT